MALTDATARLLMCLQSGPITLSALAVMASIDTKSVHNRLRTAVESGKVGFIKASGRDESQYYLNDEALLTLAKRTCLMCGKQFNSFSPANRLCNTCKRREVSPFAPYVPDPR